MKSFPSQIFVKKEVDGEDSYLVASETAQQLADLGEEIPVATYRLERVGKLVVKAEVVDNEQPTAGPAPKKSRATKKEKPTEPPASPEAVEAASPPTVTQKDVEVAVDKLFDAKGLEVTRSVLHLFGVSRGRDLKPAQYAGFVQKAADALAGKEI